MLYIKEDLIIPNSLTFYELIINKARGKSGPLFHFDVHEVRGAKLCADFFWMSGERAMFVRGKRGR